MESLFLRACRNQPIERVPVWLMRQAGRYMSEYRELRARHSFLELCKQPDLAAEVTLHARQVLQVDAAILFADILLIVECLGLKLTFAKGDGPVITEAVRTPEAVARLLSRQQGEADERLTPREQEEPSLMAEGRSNAAIAGRLFGTEKAVAKHINNIFAKLDLPLGADDHRRVLAVLAWLHV